MGALLDRHSRSVRAERERTLLRPQPAAKAEEGEKAPPQDAAKAGPQEVVEVDLRRALAFAVEKNRDYLTRSESLYREGLAFTLTRFQFGPQLAATVSLLWTGAKNTAETTTGSGALSASQILPTGGTVSADAGASHTRTQTVNGIRDFATDVNFQLSQPLLRGAGYEASHEALTLGERGLLYAIRDFELFRETFAISIARDYFDLISRRKTLENDQRDYEQAKFDRDRAETLYRRDRNTETEVFRARRREIDAESQLIAQRARYKRALDDFKIRLGLPTDVELVPDLTEPEVIPVSVELVSAIAAAKNNRLDLHTQRDRIDDAERAVRIAKNGLLPDLSVNLAYGFADEHRTSSGALADDWSSSASLLFQVPIQQKPERNAYRSALISLVQARRSFELTIDTLELGIQDQLRTLQSLEQRIDLQKAQIEREKRAVLVTQTRYEAGTIENRDLLEARDGLIQNQNQLIQLKVDHFIGRLELLRTLGLLSIDDKGMWK